MRSGALALGITLLQSGCASLPPDVRHQGELGTVAVIAGIKTPELSFTVFPRTPALGAAIGAGSAFLSCASIGPRGCNDAMCGAVVLVWTGVCGVGTVAGAVVGAAVSPSADAVRRSEAELIAALEPRVIQEALRDQVIAAFAAAGGPPVTSEQADTLLEVALTRVGLDSQLQLYMHATVRLVRRRDGAELSSTEYVHTGARNTLAEWSENDGARLLGSLKAGYESLGAHIHDSVFLQYPFPDREWQAGSIFVTSYGLAPVEPQVISPWLTLTGVASLQPTLQWQSFPREVDVFAAPDIMARVRNVRYDLVIAREQNLAPAEIVYRREGLEQAAHKLETPLASGAQYFWTVRARFDLDGRKRVTSWGSTQYSARETWTAPSRHSYRFRTQ